MMEATQRSFEALFKEAIHMPLNDEQPAWLDERWVRGTTSTMARRWIAPLTPHIKHMLMIGHRGYRMLLADGLTLPQQTIALAMGGSPRLCQRLQRWGVLVVREDARHFQLPFAPHSFDLLYMYNVTQRPLRNFAPHLVVPGGRLVYCWAGKRHLHELTTALGGAVRWEAPDVVAHHRFDGFVTLDEDEATSQVIFHDIGALVYALRLANWNHSLLVRPYIMRALRTFHDRLERTLDPVQFTLHMGMRVLEKVAA